MPVCILRPRSSRNGKCDGSARGADGGRLTLHHGQQPLRGRSLDRPRRGPRVELPAAAGHPCVLSAAALVVGIRASAGSPTNTHSTESSTTPACRPSAPSSREREALYLKGLGYSYTEIMRLTGASYTAVNRRITEGRAALREQLGDDGPCRR